MKPNTANTSSVGTAADAPGPDEIQTYLYDGDTDSGFIIRNEGDGVFKAEEWRQGDIADNAYGTYEEMKAWTETESAQHTVWRSEAHVGSPENR